MPIVSQSKLCVHFIIIFKHEVSEFFVFYRIGGDDINGGLEWLSTIFIVVFPVCRTCKQTGSECQCEPRRWRAPIPQDHKKTSGELLNGKKLELFKQKKHLCENTYHFRQCNSSLKKKKKN